MVRHSDLSQSDKPTKSITDQALCIAITIPLATLPPYTVLYIP